MFDESPKMQFAVVPIRYAVGVLLLPIAFLGLLLIWIFAQGGNPGNIVKWLCSACVLPLPFLLWWHLRHLLAKCPHRNDAALLPIGLGLANFAALIAASALGAALGDAARTALLAIAFLPLPIIFAEIVFRFEGKSQS